MTINEENMKYLKVMVDCVKGKKRLRGLKAGSSASGLNISIPKTVARKLDALSSTRLTTSRKPPYNIKTRNWLARLLVTFVPVFCCGIIHISDTGHPY